ncbi:MAG: alcohol dehydrogenase catalytic domain-containing protein [Reichenbachiella sp.]|uniref:alcohol dehydrogenase catalytic domain-containing protein n=1 Tax=Reichenbachiella sp. TaxID=2184521 RepID=UPI0029662746|nr:alcohol dehydrogenase catalytic domain-containing protein [Reichenbachiella sp.]MDW3212204.1 alcohol dehydrogenase catalytic domain-containing protein [Reichenbachiella sp.]
MRIDLMYCGICGSDVSHFNGNRPIEYPFSLGHEFCGKIIEVSKTNSKFQIGQFVTSDLNFRCNECEFCNKGKSHLCNENKKELFSNRGFAKYMDIHQDYLFLVDKPIGYLASLCEPLSCCIHAIDISEIQKRNKVLILGTGSIGSLLTLAFCEKFSETPVWLFDKVLTKCLALSKCFKNASQLEYVEPEFDFVFDTTGTSHGLKLACDTVKKGGKLIVMSHLDESNDDIIHSTLARKEVSVTFPYLNGERKNMEKAISILTTKLPIHFNSLIDIHPLQSLQACFENMTRTKTNKIIIDINNSVN